MEFILIGDPGSKRSCFFKKAVEEAGHFLQLISWEAYISSKENIEESHIVKIDPPVYSLSEIAGLPQLIKDYNSQLMDLDRLTNVSFINRPKQICLTLDKVKCKQLLLDHNIPTPAMVFTNIHNHKELCDYCQKNRGRGLFIKPRYGSGAAGILAYRYHPKTKEQVIYTSLAINNNLKLYNTKHMRRVTDPYEVSFLVDEILKQDVIIEHWVQKAKYQGLSYDLRVVYQYGHISYIVVRGSKSPITNLHLNNGAIYYDALSLPRDIHNRIVQLCHDTMACLPGLFSAGIDILVTPKGSPMVIEVNGQGDLVYQDIFDKNQIYRSQVIGAVKQYELQHR